MHALRARGRPAAPAGRHTAAVSSRPPPAAAAMRTMGAAAAAAATTGAAAAAPSQAATQQQQLPATYRRLVAKRTGTCFRNVAECVSEPLPSPGPGEVLLRLTYAGINGGCETFRARGEYAFAGNKAKAQFALGAEGAGVVVAAGPNVTNLAVGQAVACNSASAFAEYAIAAASACTPVPTAGPEAVALTLSALTAAAALEGTAAVQSGEVVLVTAAAGGTGHFAVQLAALAGARVVAVTGSDDKKRRLQGLGSGVERVINYKTEDVAAVLAAEYPQGVNVVYEGVGGALREAIMAHLAPGARVLQVGYISEYPHTSEAVSPAEGGLPMDQMFWGGKVLELDRGVKVYGQVWPKDVAAIKRAKARVFELHAQGRLQAWVDESHGFRGVEQVADAVEYMLQGGHTGKVVIAL